MNVSGEIEAARSHPAIVASVVVACTAVTACALVAIAWMAGWIPEKASGGAPTAIAIPGSQVAGSAPDLGLAPGETLVAPAETPKAPATTQLGPVIPQYNKQPDKPPSPAPAPAPAPAPVTTPQPAPPVVAKPRPAPATPAYARAAPPVTSYERSARTLCVNCGTVASSRSVEGEWEVRVKFEDGSTETLRYPEPQRFRAGDRVHMEDGRLLPD